MRLANFSVTNYRSITTANKINLKELTVLVGKNNEGKSNLLSALNVAMSVLMHRTRFSNTTGRVVRRLIDYQWDRDFPIQLRDRKNGLESIFRLEFELDDSELAEFKALTGITNNQEIPILIRIGSSGLAKIEVPKKGSAAYKEKSKQIADFISHHISFNYIGAIRTEEQSIDVLRDILSNEFRPLEDNPEYRGAMRIISDLQDETLSRISSQLLIRLKLFLPRLKDVKIKKYIDNYIYRPFRNDFDIELDDGVCTSISRKGEGVKSLVALALLKDRDLKAPSSIIAIEEPETHLHPEAIHRLVEVIYSISKNDQVIITTHNPLFVQQNDIQSNIIVNNGIAQPAKSIEEIRTLLGIRASDNLRNADFVLVVEGEDDKRSLSKLLPVIDNRIGKALSSNRFVIKPLNGASNLTHELYDLKNCLCQYVVLLDNDAAGKNALEKAQQANLIDESRYRLTTCLGAAESEFEDCIRTEIYAQSLKDRFFVNIDIPAFRGNNKWSNRIKKAIKAQGGHWTVSLEEQIKLAVADSIPANINKIEDVLITQKSSFLYSLAEQIINMLENRNENTDSIRS